MVNNQPLWLLPFSPLDPPGRLFEVPQKWVFSRMLNYLNLAEVSTQLTMFQQAAKGKEEPIVENNGAQESLWSIFPESASFLL